MKLINDKSIDMILCDLPYGINRLIKWDTVIPFDELWEQYERIIKHNGVIILTASQPFTSALVMSNPKLFRYEIIWIKDRATLFQQANKMPMKKHENILVFYKKLPTYNPQFNRGKPYKDNRTERKGMDNYLEKGCVTNKKQVINDGKRYPTTDLFVPCEVNRKHIHPTQKPVALFEWLINTYTNKNELVLDNCMGSGTTAIACMNTNRNYIGFEKDEKYYQLSLERIKNHKIDEL